jgi:hypothetical protein
VVSLTRILGANSADPPVVLCTPLRLNDITNNLQKLADDWRDSGMPNELWEIGVTELVVEGVGEQLTLEWRGRTSPVNNPALFLTFVRLPDGGSEVTARFGRGTLQIFALLLLLTTPLQAMASEAGPARWYFLAASLAISLGLLVTGKSNTPLLKARLIDVVERATRARGAPPHTRARTS